MKYCSFEGKCSCSRSVYVINEVISKAKANNSTDPEQPFFQRKKELPGWDVHACEGSLLSWLLCCRSGKDVHSGVSAGRGQR